MRIGFLFRDLFDVAKRSIFAARSAQRRHVARSCPFFAEATTMEDSAGNKENGADVASGGGAAGSGAGAGAGAGAASQVTASAQSGVDDARVGACVCVESRVAVLG